MGLEVLIGAVLPVLIEFVAKYVQNTNLKFIISLLVPLILGGLLNYQSLSLGNVEAILGSGAIIFAAAQGVYKLYFRDSALQRKIQG